MNSRPQSLQPQPSQQPSSSTSTSAPASSKPDVKLSSSAHLDPNAYVRGHHQIQIGKNSLVHPRAHLLAIHGPLIVGDNCVVSEKCLLGGPLPPSSSSSSTAPPSAVLSSDTPPVINNGDETMKPTFIANNVHLHAHAQISHGSTIAPYVVIESHATIQPSVNVGKHSKICAGVTVDRDVAEWTVVFGDGDQRRLRRRRKPNESMDELEGGEEELVERARLKAMEKEREATLLILKNAARQAVARKK